jgi:hypothetical protein
MKVLNRFSGTYINKIYDPIQTHALYGLGKDNLDQAKRLLKEDGAKRFRVVKTNTNGLVILCFKL